MKKTEAPLVGAAPKKHDFGNTGLVLVHLLMTIFVAVMIGLHGMYLFRQCENDDTTARTIVLNDVLTQYMQHQVEEEQHMSAITARDAYVQVTLNAIGQETESAAYLFSETGVCIAHSQKAETGQACAALPKDLLQKILAEGSFTADVSSDLRIDPSETRPVTICASLITVTETNGKESRYILFTSTYSDTVDRYIFVMLVVSIAVILISLAVCIIALRLVQHRRNQPIRAITDAIQRCAKGDYSTELEPYQYANPQYTETALILNQLMSVLREINQQQSEFVSNVSHELRTPMTVISGYVDGILDGTVPKAKRMEYLAIVSQEMQRLKILVSSMLNLTKLEKGTIQMKCDYFSIRDMVFRTILMFETRLEKKNVNVEGLDGTERVRVYGDYDLIGQVVYNFIENAVKFVDTNGTISFRFENKKDFILFSVRNTGSGIKKDEVRKIFERFYKSDFSRSDDKTGLGLGLNISRRILDLHGARVLVNSEVDVFTEFEIRFPYGPKSEESMPQKAPDSSTT